jgi:hypothetical protein
VPQKQRVLQQWPPRVEELSPNENGQLNVAWAAPHGQLNGVMHRETTWQPELFLPGVDAQVLQ